MTAASVRDSFVARFGEEQAVALETAAADHENGVHDKRGSDPFKWAISIGIGYECFIVDSYREHHGITVPLDEITDWIRSDADLASHDGDVDFLALFCGKYDEFIVRAEVQS